ncbi:MAG: serine hydrolase domain-containing protein, partial [Rubrivivax sp.]
MRARRVFVGVLGVVLGLVLGPVLGLGVSNAQVDPAARALAVQPLPPSLVAELETLQREEQLVGVVVATLVNGEIRASALGHAHGPSQRPMPPDSRLQTGSVAKTLITLGLLRLVSQGRMALDAEVQPLLPGWPIDNPWAATTPLRLRHLLDMSAGLPDVRLWQMFDARHRSDQPLAHVWERDPSVLRLRTPPGRQFNYSNLCHTLAAALLEAVTGEPYERWMAREVLAPLGLTDSTFAFTSPDAPQADPRVAWGHVDDGSAIAAVPVAVRPAAQFITTGPDLMRLAAFLMAGDGRVAGQPFIRADLLAGMGVPPLTEAAAAQGLATGYGLGLFTRDRHGALARCHGGSVAGFRALWCFDRTTASAYAVLHNSDREAARLSRFEALMVRHLGWSATPQPPQPAASDVDRWNGRYVPTPSRLEGMTLIDRLMGGWTLKVTSEGGTWTPDLGPARVLVPQGGHRFRQDDRVQTTLVLFTDERGAPVVAGQGITLHRQPAMVGWGQRALALAGALGLAVLAVLPAMAAWRGPARLRRLARPGTPSPPGAGAGRARQPRGLGDGGGAGRS